MVGDAVGGQAVNDPDARQLCECDPFPMRVSAQVTVVVVHLDQRTLPVALLHDEDYPCHVCLVCKSHWRQFVTEAVQGSAKTKGWVWTEALIVCADGRLIGFTARDDATPMRTPKIASA